MARTLWCRHCGDTYDSIAGTIPPICPNPDCKKSAKWSTTPGNPHKERRKNPRVPYELNHNDRRFLKSLRIETDQPPPPPNNNDHESDGA